MSPSSDSASRTSLPSLRVATVTDTATLLAAIPAYREVICVRCHRNIMEGGGPWTYHTNWDKRGPICVDCWFAEADADAQRDWEEGLRELQRDLKEADG